MVDGLPERMSAVQRHRIATVLALGVLLVLGSAVVGVVVGVHHKHPHQQHSAQHVHLVPLLVAILVPVLIIAALAVFLVKKREVIFQPSPLFAIEGNSNRRQVWRAAMKGQPVAAEHLAAVRGAAERASKLGWVVWAYLGVAALQVVSVVTERGGARPFHTVLGCLFLVLAGATWVMARRVRALAARLRRESTPTPTPTPTPVGEQQPQP
jgi:hypothetical protein